MNLKSLGVLVFLLVGILLLSGCLSSKNVNSVGSATKLSPEVESIVSKCVNLCQVAVSEGQNISSGPCLSNQIAPGWVCDVAHWPRQPVDNLPENQCPAFGKSAHAFVEVSPSCKPIRVWDGKREYVLSN